MLRRPTWKLCLRHQRPTHSSKTCSRRRSLEVPRATLYSRRQRHLPAVLILRSLRLRLHAANRASATSPAARVALGLVKSADSRTTNPTTKRLPIYWPRTRLRSVKSHALEIFLRPGALMPAYHTRCSMISLPSLALKVQPGQSSQALCADSSVRARATSKATALAIAEWHARVPSQALKLTPVERHLSLARQFANNSSYSLSISALPRPRSL